MAALSRCRSLPLQLFEEKKRTTNKHELTRIKKILLVCIRGSLLILDSHFFGNDKMKAKIKDIIIVLLLLPWLVGATPQNELVAWFVRYLWLQPKAHPVKVGVMCRKNDSPWMACTSVIVEPETRGTDDWKTARHRISLPGYEIYIWQCDTGKVLVWNMKDLHR